MKTTFKYLLVLILASFVFVGCCTTRNETVQWEYKVVVLRSESPKESDLNKLGKEGWILVSVTPLSTEASIVSPSNSSSEGSTHTSLLKAEYILKRPKH